MEPKAETLELLRQFKCKLVRTKKHNIYTLPNGIHYTTPQSASDYSSWNNCLSDLKIALGISRRGRKAKVGTPARKVHKATVSEKKLFDNITPAPINFDFREKMRAALRGEKPTRSEPAPAKVKLRTDREREKARTPRREERGRDGVARAWSKADIEAANRAMRVGKLDEFMQNHYTASRPEAVLINQPTKEETTMLAVEQIDTTIHELDSGMSAAMSMSKTEEANIRRLDSEMVDARLRMQAAHDKYNSLNDVKTSLSVLRGDIEKVRPMLGLLAHQKPETVTTRTRRSGVGLKISQAIEQVLDTATAPMSPKQMRSAITQLQGSDTFPLSTFYNFLNRDLKQNGKAITKRIGDGLYWRAGRELPGAASAV